MIRKALQAGKYRLLLSLLVGGLSFIAIRGLSCYFAAHEVNPLDAGQKIAFVAAAFSVTAYNLRTRVVDLILKIDASPGKARELARIARGCGKRLTNLVVFFTFTALLLGAGGLFPKGSSIGLTFASASFALFSASCVNFIYILFAFESLERLALDESEEAAKRKEAQRLTKG